MVSKPPRSSQSHGKASETERLYIMLRFSLDTKLKMEEDLTTAQKGRSCSLNKVTEVFHGEVPELLSWSDQALPLKAGRSHQSPRETWLIDSLGGSKVV